MSFLDGKYFAITIGDVEIDLSRAEDPSDATKYNEAAVVQPAPYESLVIDQALVNGLSTDVGALFPSGLSITIKDVSFSKTSAGKAIAANFGLDLDFSALPLVGHMFPADLKFSVEDIQILMYTGNETLDSTEIDALDALLPTGIAPLPTVVTPGVNFSATLNAGTTTQVISSGSLSQLGTPSQSGNSANTASGGKSSQGNVNKKFGPVFIQSVGIDFTNGDLNFVVTGSIKMGPLTITLDGLSIGSPLNEFAPEASLHGLSVDYHNDTINIGGGLVHDTVDGLIVYNGALTVDLTKFQMSALGSYADDHGNPSFFVFAQLNEPLGGPSFFFVTGLAFTFGYNRNLVAPQVQDVSTFPLIQAAAGNIAAPKAGATSLIPPGMNTYLPPQVGEYFVGIGVKFTSFKVINSFALFIVKFGKELEFDLLGLSSYIAPNPTDPKPVATVELEIVGSYKPAAGTLLIRGMLTPNSFVLSKQCHLHGGFAIACWTENSPHSGEFVFSFGGYGNHYTPQPYYPQNIPELGFLWQVDSNLSIKGGGYWTITPHRVVAGGFLKAVYNIGWVRASFNINAYFMIDWSPLHYEGHFQVEFSLDVHIDFLFVSCWLGFTVGEGLRIHGPEFGGVASISLYVCTVNIAFGSAPEPKPLLDWATFQSSFTPAKSDPTTGAILDMVKVNLISGLIKTANDATAPGGKVEVVNPKDLSFSISTFIPNTTYQFESDSKIHCPDFGVAPMGVDLSSDTTTSPYNSALEITIENGDGQFLVKIPPGQNAPVNQSVPRAMWGLTTDTSEGRMVLAFNDLTIALAKPPTAGETIPIKREDLAWEIEQNSNGNFAWNTLIGFDKSSSQETTISNTASNNQSAVLTALGLAMPTNAISDLENRLAHTNSSVLVGSL